MRWRSSSVTLLAVLALAARLGAGSSAAEPSATPDYTKEDMKSVGLRPVSPSKDPKTGFVVGGKNATASIGKLTQLAGRSIADLEKVMRPGASSDKGFLGKEERLLDVLAADNRYVVDTLGLTHQDLARHLHVLGALAVRHAHGKPLDIRYHGRKLRIQASCTRGFQESPFEDGTKANCDATVENLETGKKLNFSLLVPYMIERYGFYEGKGTPYRVEPEAILLVLDFLKPAKGPAK